MSNLNQEEMLKRGELVKRARQILIQEYTAMRNQQHQQWVRDSAMTWKNKGVLIAYPPAKMYPTEQEVVAKALELFNRSNQPIATVSNTPVTPVETTPIEPITQVTDSELPMLYQDALTPSITEQLQAAYNAPVERSVITPEPIVEEPIVEEPIVEEPIVEEPPESAESSPKHSLLRSVLSGWLSKNKDKDKPQ
jgi:hypothetical protein